ncbi:ThiF family adenylyltransferase [Paenibacillus oenotherae]|uniref:ThiF family adenylyltransferase n=1 Tax=Paenibacillus oenotherae TaxID=1435645 RepID=A0ABS7DD83_9BACL|nr:ThiF family adenylyltransferase [Paenibacillus oenotherae]MBW7477795.1 ThiF family adenylyltransferase [Paenibacillus oenotherae]
MNGEDIERYSRQIRFAPIGQAGQKKLIDSHVAIVGMGALGSVSAQHLVRSGVGKLRIIDRDVLEWSNLQRQVLYTEDDVRRMLPKAAAAAERLTSINSSVAIEPIIAELSPMNAESLLGDVDLIIDGSDNFFVRYLMNDISLKLRIPWIYGGVVGASGMTMTILPHETPCFRCLFPVSIEAGAADTCETAGVISPAVDLIASIQATEALKWLSGSVDALHGTLLQADLWNNHWTPLKVSRSKRKDCPACGEQHYHYLEQGEQELAAASLCGRNTIQISPGRTMTVSLDQLASRLAPIGAVERNPFLLRFKRDESISIVLFPDGRALIQGTEDLLLAKRIYNEIYGL